ncbi:MAG: hypothetical protein QM765_06575 [Myxococcales bacterium]
MEHPKRPDIEDDELDPMGDAADRAQASPPVEPLGGDDLEDVELDSETGAPEFGEPAEGRGLSDMLRKAMVAGLGAVFMTEEGIRTYVKDLKLPKDVMGFVVGQAERSKAELFRVIGEELHRFFESELLRREVGRLLSQMTLEVHAEIRLKPSDGSVGAGLADGEELQESEPAVKVKSATVRRTGKKKGKR